MAAKGRALSIVLAILAIFATSSALASIPRSTILDPTSAIDSGARSEEPRPFRQPAGVIDASIDNAELLHHAIDGALATPAPVDTLSESRVWVSRLERPLIDKERPLLTHALDKGSAAAWPEIASEPTVLTPDPLGYIDSSNLYAFCGGDPVNCSDPTGKWGLYNRDTWDALKGVGRSVKKTAVGAALGVALLIDAGSSSPTNFQSKLQLVEAAIQTKAAVAGWGTSAGYAIAEPEQISQALNELSADEIGEEMFDAAVTTSMFVTPAARARVAMPPAVAPTIVRSTASAPKINPQLAQRLSAYKAWKADVGITGAPTSVQFRRFVGAHRPASRGATLYPSSNAFGGNSLFARWSRAVESAHGNSRLSPAPAYLYRLWDDTGTFLKWGIAEDPAARYRSTFMRGKFIEPVMKGPRSIVLDIERAITEIDPGPLNFEPWAGAKR